MAPALRMVSSIPSIVQILNTNALLDTCKQDDLQIFLLIRHQEVIESASILLWKKSRRCGGRKKIFGGGQFWWQAHQISPPDAPQKPGLTASFSSSKINL